jgi:hypothetical protein
MPNFAIVSFTQGGLTALMRKFRGAKTVAELTSRQDCTIRQHLTEQLMRQIMHYDAEFRREDAADVIGSQVRHWIFAAFGAAEATSHARLARGGTMTRPPPSRRQLKILPCVTGLKFFGFLMLS